MRLYVSALVFLTAATSFAQQSFDPYYQAIRNDDLPALRMLVASQGANPERGGHETPLMTAAAFGSLDAVSLLLHAGADPAAKTDFGITALHRAVGNIDKVRLLLLESSVDADAMAGDGRTPLSIAAATNGASETVRALLRRGAKVDIVDRAGMSPLLSAAFANDVASVRLLLDAGADANARGATGFTPLMGAAMTGNVDLAQVLLDAGADVNAVSNESNGEVTHGPIAIGYMTPLHFAAQKNLEIVKLLLESGAKVNVRDVRGMTPLMIAVSLDSADPEIIRVLLNAGSDPSIASKDGETTLDWARKFNEPAILSQFQIDAVNPPAPKMSTAATEDLPTPQEAVERALPKLQAAADDVFNDSGCIACHAQPVVEMGVSLARKRGWQVDEELSKHGQDAMDLNFRARGADYMAGIEAGGLPDAVMYMLLSYSGNEIAPSPSTDVAVSFLAMKQGPDGSWTGRGGSRAPIQDGAFTLTALGIRGLSVYGPPAKTFEYQQKLALAGRWLALERPLSTEPRVMQVLGLYWSGVQPEIQSLRLKELINLQRENGGWGQTPNLEADAYATGMVLWTLHTLGVPSSDPAFRRGVEFLLRTQKPDGTWFVRSRAMKLQPYFESGFPYGHDQWISTIGTAWATVGLGLSEPEQQSAAAGN